MLQQFVAVDGVTGVGVDSTHVYLITRIDPAVCDFCLVQVAWSEAAPLPGQEIKLGKSILLSLGLGVRGLGFRTSIL